MRMNTVLLHKGKRGLDARTNLTYQFEDWFYEEHKIKSKTSHNCGNYYKLMNCRVNITYFVKSHGILSTVLKKTKRQWKREHGKIVFFTFQRISLYCTNLYSWYNLLLYVCKVFKLLKRIKLVFSCQSCKPFLKVHFK